MSKSEYSDCPVNKDGLVDFSKFADETEIVSVDHYGSSMIEPIEYINKNGLSFCEGNVVKYITRHREKNGQKDVLKAIDYCIYILCNDYGMSVKAVYDSIGSLMLHH